jgi:hypothetical protein
MALEYPKIQAMLSWSIPTLIGQRRRRARPKVEPMVQVHDYRGRHVGFERGTNALQFMLYDDLWTSPQLHACRAHVTNEGRLDMLDDYRFARVEGDQ